MTTTDNNFEDGGEWSYRLWPDDVGAFALYDGNGLFMGKVYGETIAAQIVNDHRAVRVLVEALQQADAFFQKLEDDGDQDDGLVTARRRFHAPVRARIHDALATAARLDRGEGQQ